MKTLTVSALSAICCLFANGCDTSSELSLQSQVDGSTSIGMGPPSFLLNTREVDQSQLVLDVSANNISIETEQNTQGIEQGELNFDPGETITIGAAWSAVGSTLLPLASARRTVTVPSDPAGIIVPIEESRFTTNFDSDGDLRTNIAELRAGTDPRDANSPNTPVERLPVNINFGIPAALQGEDAATVNALSLAVLVNDRVFSVTRNGNVWSGVATEVAGNDVFIEASFFSNSDRDVLLEGFEIRQQMDTNGLFLGLDTPAPIP